MTIADAIDKASLIDSVSIFAFMIVCGLEMSSLTSIEPNYASFICSKCFGDEN